MTVVWSGAMRTAIPGCGGITRTHDYLTDYGATDGLFVREPSDPGKTRVPVTPPPPETRRGRPAGTMRRCRCGRVVPVKALKRGRRPTCPSCWAKR